MVLVNGRKFACQTCIKGHRSSKCTHTERPLIEIKKKGRPTSQCSHCRHLRKTRSVHLKCVCSDKKEEKEATFLPNGLKDVLASTSAAPPAPLGVSHLLNACFCHGTGKCVCSNRRSTAGAQKLSSSPQKKECCKSKRELMPKPAESAGPDFSFDLFDSLMSFEGSVAGPAGPSAFAGAFGGAFTGDSLPAAFRGDSLPAAFRGDSLPAALSGDSLPGAFSRDSLPGAFSGDSLPGAFSDLPSASSSNPPHSPPLSSPLSTSSSASALTPDALFIPTTVGTHACFCGDACQCSGCPVHDPARLKAKSNSPGCGCSGSSGNSGTAEPNLDSILSDLISDTAAPIKTELTLPQLFSSNNAPLAPLNSIWPISNAEMGSVPLSLLLSPQDLDGFMRGDE